MTHQGAPSLRQGDYVTLDRRGVHTFSPPDSRHTDCGMALDQVQWYHPMAASVDLATVCVQCGDSLAVSLA